MINVSSEFKRKIYEDDRNFINTISLRLNDGTVLTIENDKIMENGIQFDDAVGEDNTFSALGGVVINSFTLILNNIYEDFSDYDFTKAVVTDIEMGLPLEDSTIESIHKGVFIVDDTAYNGATITLTCLDNMSKFDVPYSESTLIYGDNGRSLLDVVHEACTHCDVKLANNSETFPRFDTLVKEPRDKNTITYREVLSWVATIAGCFARCNVAGELEFKWFNVSEFEKHEGDLDGGIFDTDSDAEYLSGDTANGGSFNPWNTGDVYSGGSLADLTVTNIYGLYSQDIGTDDVVITKIVCTTKSEEELTEEQIQQGIISADGMISYSTGLDGYEIVIENNQFITASNIKNIVDYLGNQLIGLRFRRVNVTHLSDPTIEAGDVAYVWDRKVNKYQILITRTSFSITAAQTTVCGASTPLRNSAKRFTEATKSYVEARNMIVKTRTDLEERLEQAGGLYDSLETQPDGSSIRYFHNKPDLYESDIRIIISSVGITVTANGLDEHPDWYGLTVDGDLIVEILNATGINANWINAGQIAITKDSGEEVFFADFISKTVRIHADTILMQSGDNVEVVIAQATDDLAALKMHYRFDETGETIGREGSSESVKLSNDGINMMVYNESVTKWTQDEMYTPTRVRVPLGGSLQLGDFIFQPRSNGNISLLFIGEE